MAKELIKKNMNLMKKMIQLVQEHLVKFIKLEIKKLKLNMY